MTMLGYTKEAVEWAIKLKEDFGLHHPGVHDTVIFGGKAYKYLASTYYRFFICESEPCKIEILQACDCWFPFTFLDCLSFLNAKGYRRTKLMEIHRPDRGDSWLFGVENPDTEVKITEECPTPLEACLQVLFRVMVKGRESEKE